MSTEEKEGKARHEEIENQLKRDKMMQRNEIKMLLLGMFPFHAPASRSSCGIDEILCLQVPVNPASPPF